MTFCIEQKNWFQLTVYILRKYISNEVIFRPTPHGMSLNQADGKLSVLRLVLSKLSLASLRAAGSARHADELKQSVWTINTLIGTNYT